MREVKLIVSENDIPKGYYYDTENSWIYEYRNPYTGDVIQIAKEPPLYIKTSLITEELKKLKTEIEEYMNISFGEDDDIKDGNIINIIDKRILELKGEQK